jgi:chromosome segregation ATPase
LSYPDFAQALQARIRADLPAEQAGHPPCSCPDPAERRTVGKLEAKLEAKLRAKIAALEDAVAKAEAKAEALGEQRRQDAETAKQRLAAEQAHIAELEQAVAKAEARGEQWRRKAQTTAKRADGLVAELVELTSELVEMSKRIAQQTAATDKVRAELDDYRSRSWWWQHATG